MLKSERTQERIRDAARAAFAERGFEATSLRSIADAAGVDPALCIHYFGSKAGLFDAATELPVEPAALLASVAVDPDHVGERVARTFLAMLDDETSRSSLLALIRSAASDDQAALLVRDLVTERIVAPALANLTIDHADLRATLVGSQLIGLAFARHVVGIGPLAEVDTDTLVAAVAPALEHYLTGALP